MLSTRAFKHIACTTLAAATAISLAGCSNPLSAITSSFGTPSVEEAKASQLASVSSELSSANLVEEGTLTVGLSSSEGAPMCITAEDGSFSGYDVDVASALADELGLKVSFVQVSSLSSALGDTCDIVMNVTSTHASGMTIAGSYAEDATAFFAKDAAKTDSAVNASEISGKIVGVQANSTSQQLLLRSDLNAEQSTFTNLNEAFQALEDGAVDYVLCDALAGSYLAEVYSDVSLVGTIDVPETIGVATESSNTALQTAVQEGVAKLNSNGVIEVIRNKWINGMQTLSSSSQVSGVTISSGAVESTTSDENSDSDESSDTSATSGPQDGSTAGANAVDVE